MTDAMPPATTPPNALRSAIVTGGAKGLGAAFANRLAEHGYAVVVNNRHSGDGLPSAQKAVNALTAAGLTAVADTHAVQAPGAAEAMVAKAIDSFGRLDALILNAGIVGPLAKVADLDDLELDEVLSINFRANLALVKAALPALHKSPGGRIVFVSSTAGLFGVKGRAAYAASKGALNAFALTLAAEQRRYGVGVNILMPYAATAMTGDASQPLADVIRAEDVAPIVEWLASEACTETGTIWIAGGRHVKRALPIESAIAGPHDGSAQWFEANASAIGTADLARGHPHAEAAFAKFHHDLG